MPVVLWKYQVMFYFMKNEYLFLLMFLLILSELDSILFNVKFCFIFLTLYKYM